MNILNNYEIRFDTIDVYGSFRVMHSVNELLSAYVTEFNSYSRASQLLNSINNLLASDQKGCGTTQGMISVITESGVTKLSMEVPEYVNESLQLDFELPTTHLKEIVEAWVSYLKEEANVSMVIQYLKELEDLNAMKLFNVFSNLPLAMGDIVKMEMLYNSGTPFPKSLRELLYIAGNYCSVIDLGSDPFAYQMEIRDAIIYVIILLINLFLVSINLAINFR
ncbi:hypothetical protein R1T16_11160 [Flavobacterium sp. DG1-102-2]|uniref:hypothetical protein n=1 Tax=Flavobacterium sp. DG1-102-2 TaxID=3081663 RepID=UPI0029495CE8|nr:hypothetical protein [Flavobacterium sp. DG1-102-2]MDV6168987.1 hypothetical protein [Flavobacterium sp. DG1-102-2]